MKAYTAEIILFVDYFESDSPMSAEVVVNEYIDTLADIAPASLTWSSCDWKLTEIEIAE